MEEKEEKYNSLIQIEGLALASNTKGVDELAELLIKLLQQEDVKKYIDLIKEARKRGIGSMFG